jgi:hypothetical protein
MKKNRFHKNERKPAEFLQQTPVEDQIDTTEPESYVQKEENVRLDNPLLVQENVSELGDDKIFEDESHKTGKESLFFTLFVFILLTVAAFLFLYPVFYFSYEKKTEQDGRPTLFQDHGDLADPLQKTKNSAIEQQPISENIDDDTEILFVKPNLSEKTDGDFLQNQPLIVEERDGLFQPVSSSTHQKMNDESGAEQEKTKNEERPSDVFQTERQTVPFKSDTDGKESVEKLQQDYALLNRDVLLLKEQMRHLAAYKQKNVSSLFSLLLLKQALEERKEYETPLQMFYALNQDNPIATALYNLLSQSPFPSYQDLMEEYKELYEIESVNALISPQDSLLFKKLKQVFFSAVQVRKISHFTEDDSSAFAILSKAYFLLEEKKLQEAERLLTTYENLFSAKMKTFLKNMETHRLAHSYMKTLLDENISALLPKGQQSLSDEADR